MQKIHKLISKLAPTQSIVPGALLMAMLQLPMMPFTLGVVQGKPILPLKQDKIEEAQALLNAKTHAGEVLSLAQVFFGESTSREEAEAIIDKQISFVSTRKAYPASLAVIQNRESLIREKAQERNVPEDVAIGVALLENGGSEQAVSPAGALGVFQLMPGTARNLGLTVTKKVDERRIPEKNIDAGIRYLRANYERFGDWGLATWAYHAGEGNVAKALKLYAKANHGVSLVGLKDLKSLRSYVEKHDITIHKLLSHSSVRALTKKLNDDSAGYPYKVVATATLFEQSKSHVSAR